MDTAWRTRRSANGFLPLTFDDRSSRLPLIEAKKDPPGLVGTLSFRPGVPSIWSRSARGIAEEVDLAAQQSLEAQSRILDHRVHDAIEIVRVLGAPTIRRSGHHRADARREAHELERPRAVGVTLGIGPSLAVDCRQQASCCGPSASTS